MSTDKLPRRKELTCASHGTGIDWCHLCGERSDNIKADCLYPTNAEHGGKQNKYLRICLPCLKFITGELEKEQNRM
jgi:hypothetical protein